MKILICLLLLVSVPAMAGEFTRNNDLFNYVAAENRDLGYHSGRDWTNADKALAALYQILNAADWAQTRQIARQPEQYYERTSDWLVGEHPSRRSVNAMFLANALLQPIVTNALDNPWRSLFQAYTVGSRIPAVRSNQQLGLDAVRW